MKLTPILLFIISWPCMSQNDDSVKQYLTNGKYRQWKVIGTASHLGTKSCDPGGGYYTFYEDKLVVQKCENRSWVADERTFDVIEEGDEKVILINDKTLYYKKLSANAPVCDGNENCIRISYAAIHKDEFTTDIYLTFE